MRIGALTTVEWNRIPLAHAFIRHYGRWCKREDIHVIVQRNDASSPNHEIRDIIERCGARFHDWTGPYSTEDIKKDHAAKTKELFDFDGWHFNVDSDELFDRFIDVPELCRRAQAHGKVFCRTQMIDMVAPEGFPPFALGNDPYAIFPVECNLTEGIVKGYPIKDCLLKNPYYGHHNAWGVDLHTQRFGGLWKLHHFKWDEASYERMKLRCLPENRERFPYWQNFKYFTDYVDQNGGVNPLDFALDHSKFSDEPRMRMPDF